MSIETKISEYLPKDKLLHFFLGFFIYCLFTNMFYDIIGLLVVSGFAISKELYDKFYKKTYIDFADIFFTVLPAIVIIITIEVN